MKIGIYGDSFAANCHNGHYAWFSVLRKLLNCEMDVYGNGATSVYYSYNHFLRTYTQYDKIIFCVTDPNRYTKSVYLSKHNMQQICHISMVYYWLEHKQNELSDIDIKILNDLKGWYMSQDDEFTIDMTELMLQKMESLHQDIIFLPCFDTSFTQDRYIKSKLTSDQSLMAFTGVQRKLLNIPKDANLIENVKNVTCHFGPELNEFLGHVIYERIISGVWDFTGVDNVKLLHDLDYYYVNGSI